MPAIRSEGCPLLRPFQHVLVADYVDLFLLRLPVAGHLPKEANRVIEVIWASVDPMELLTGKIIGLGAAGLLQVALYASMLLLPAVTVFALFQVSVAGLILSLVYFILDISCLPG